MRTIAEVEAELKPIEKEMHGWAALLYNSNEGDEDRLLYESKVKEYHAQYKLLLAEYSDIKRYEREEWNKRRMEK